MNIKDSGERQSFDTGSQRDTRSGKGRFDLLFAGMPSAVEQLAKLLEAGAVKYGEHNWKKGQPLSRFLDSALRHMSKAAQGIEDEPHLIQAAWNILALHETLTEVRAGRLPIELADLPFAVSEASASAPDNVGVGPRRFGV